MAFTTTQTEIDNLNQLLRNGFGCDYFEIAFTYISANNINFDKFPLLDGAKKLSEQIGGDFLNYAKPVLALNYREIVGALDLSAYKNSLLYVDCSHNKITSLNLSGCNSLKNLYTQCNLIRNIELANCCSLEVINCLMNKLQSLNLTDCKSLLHLQCEQNRLEQILIDGCEKLESLWCSHNRILKLDFKNNTNLIDLNCCSNKLTQVCLKTCLKLDVLDISCNKIAEISLPKSLRYLFCANTLISELNLVQLQNLREVDCDNMERLQTIILSKNASHFEFFCGDSLEIFDKIIYK